MGTEQGLLACVGIHSVVEHAKRQSDGIRHRKTSDFPDVSQMDRAEDSQLSVALMSSWSTLAHRGVIEQVNFCGHMYPAVLSLGKEDFKVRMWDPATGQLLGTLEQGPASGFSSGVAPEWLFPLNAAEQALEDRKALDAAAPAPVSRPGGGGRGGVADRQPAPAAVPPSTAASQRSASPPPPSPPLGVSRKKMAGSASEPLLQTLGTSGFLGSSARKSRDTFSFDKAPPRYLNPTARTVKRDREWLAGAFCPEHRNRGHLPSLQSGLTRPHHSEKSEVVQAAQRLSNALSALSNDSSRRAKSSSRYG